MAFALALHDLHVLALHLALAFSVGLAFCVGLAFSIGLALAFGFAFGFTLAFGFAFGLALLAAFAAFYILLALGGSLSIPAARKHVSTETSAQHKNCKNRVAEASIRSQRP